MVECIAPAPAVFPVAQTHGEVGFLPGQRSTALRGARGAHHHGFHPGQSSTVPCGTSVARPDGFHPPTHPPTPPPPPVGWTFPLFRPFWD